jgi:isocitrate dehydrogenase
VVDYKESASFDIKPSVREPQKKEQVGIDIFLHWTNGSPDQLGKALEIYSAGNLSLKVITNRGVKVYPGGFPETFCTDHWRCRFLATDGETITAAQVVELYDTISKAGFDIIKTENLYNFDGEAGFSSVHG